MREEDSVPHGGRDEVRVMFVILGLLCVFAGVTSLNLSDDSYAHYTISRDVVRNIDWRRFLTDTWSKPIPMLFYGISGQAGIVAARIAGCLVSVLAGFLVWLTFRSVSGRALLLPPVAVAAFFLCQTAVFPQSYLTMTELPSALCLAAGLYFLVKRRLLSAFICIGLMPLARIESCLVTAWAFVIISFFYFRENGANRSVLGRVLLMNVAGFLPFALWWLIGAFLTGHILWFSAEYVYIRPFDLFQVMAVNSATGFSMVLAPPQLLLLVVGLCSLPSLMDDKDGHSRKVFLWTIYGALVIHMIFLSTFVVYPRGSGWGDHAISAINSRNYNSIAPLFAVFIMAGAVRLAVVAENGIKSLAFLGWSVIAAECLIVGGYAFGKHALGLGGIVLPSLQILNQFMLVTFVLLILSAIRIRSFLPASPEKMIMSIVVFCMICLPLSNPFFWYPLRFNDNKAISQAEFGRWYKQESGVYAPLIIQDMNGTLDLFCDIRGSKVVWSYPAFIEKQLAGAPAGSIVVIETGRGGVPSPRYPEALVKKLQNMSSGYLLVAENGSGLRESAFDKIISKFASRNSPCGWQAYRKITEVKR